MRGLPRIFKAAGEAICKDDKITRWFAVSERLEDDIVAALRARVDSTTRERR